MQPGSVASYYGEGGDPIWHGSRAARSRLRDYLKVLQALRGYGLDPAAYDARELFGLARERSWKELEATASHSFGRLANDLAGGVVSPRIDFTEEELADRLRARAEYLRRIAKGEAPSELLEEISNANPMHGELVQALGTYRGYAERDAFKEVRLADGILELGDAGEGVVAVAERLRAEGFMRGPVDRNAQGEPVFGTALAAALEAFQKSRGIEPDGIVGPATLARMNESEEELVEQILVNIERSRWLPRDFGEEHVLVNIAAYDVHMQSGRDRPVRMKTVVGTERNETPVFAASMSYVVVNPYWNIPESIVRAEIAPKAVADGNYLREKNYEVVTGWQNPEPYRGRIDWDDLPGELPFRVRQRPGPNNALGRIKFMFPNDYAVYLHDTPAEALFGRTQRAFSHGCVRLERPLDFADWVFRSAVSEAPDVEDILKTGEETIIRLDKDIPVYVTYMTARVEEGRVSFFEDIYDRDERVLKALRGAS
jgi:murein L,D-transpeptidase YcbB/YkuD